jgi:glycosyltransferase 2 family protein
MRHLRFGVGLLVSGVALYVGFRGIDWPDVGTGLRNANYGLLSLAIPLLILLLVMRAYRWRLLFLPDRHVKLLSTFSALNIGYMIGNVLPLQLGEIARAYVLGDLERLSKSRAMSTVAVERLLDILVLLVMGLVLIPLVELPRVAVIPAAVFLGALAFGLAAVVVAVLDRPRVERLIDRLSPLAPARFAERVRGMSRSALDGLSALSNPRVLASAIGWTVVSWLTSAVIIYVILRAFSLDVPWTAAPFLLVVTTFSFLLPQPPGAVGVYDAVVIRTLVSVFSVAQASAASYAIVAHAMFFVPSTFLGAVLFWRYHLSLRQMRLWAQSGNDAAGSNSSASMRPASPARTEL